MNKSELLDGVRQEYQQWEALLKEIGEARMEQPGAGVSGLRSNMPLSYHFLPELAERRFADGILELAVVTHVRQC